MSLLARLRWGAAAFVAIVIVAAAAELTLVDTAGYDPPVWGGATAGVWAAIGLLSALGFAAAAYAGRWLLARERDPYADPGGERDG
jgi:hypothetical protein